MLDFRLLLFTLALGFPALTGMGCDEMTGRSTNLFGTVTLDGAQEPGVEVEVEGEMGEMFDTITGTDGSFGFIVESGTYTVRLTNLPDDVSCDEGIEQEAVVSDGESAMLTFTCETDLSATPSTLGTLGR